MYLFQKPKKSLTPRAHMGWTWQAEEVSLVPRSGHEDVHLDSTAVGVYSVLTDIMCCCCVLQLQPSDWISPVYQWHRFSCRSISLKDIRCRNSARRFTSNRHSNRLYFIAPVFYQDRMPKVRVSGSRVGNNHCQRQPPPPPPLLRPHPHSLHY